MKSEREYGLLNNYGITEQDYEDMFFSQGGKCAICGKAEDVLFVDHEHELGYVRALLCRNCNAGLGFFRDNPQLLKKAAVYVSDHILEFQTKSILGNVCTKVNGAKKAVRAGWKSIKESVYGDKNKLEELSNLNSKQIKQLASETGLTCRAISGWRSKARQELGMA